MQVKPLSCAHNLRRNEKGWYIAEKVLLWDNQTHIKASENKTRIYFLPQENYESLLKWVQNIRKSFLLCPPLFATTTILPKTVDHSASPLWFHFFLLSLDECFRSFVCLQIPPQWSLGGWGKELILALVPIRKEWRKVTPPGPVSEERTYKSKGFPH